MHRRLFVLLTLVAIFSMVTSTIVWAKPESPANPLPTAVPWRKLPEMQQAVVSRTHAPTVSTDGGVTAQAIALGAPRAFGYAQTYGVTEMAYFDDADHLNGAIGMTVDIAGNVYMVEEGGARLLKFAPDKTLLWKVGVAGLRDWGATGLNSPKEVVIGPDGKVWVADSDGVARFEPTDGAFLSRMPAEPWNVDDNLRFHNLTGIAFDGEGRLYLSDRNRQRVQVFTIVADELVYQGTVGTTDQWGSGKHYFDNPGQIAIDSSNNLFVADFFNHRVQKCTPDGTFTSWDCEIYLGTGVQGGDTDQLSLPYGLGMTGDDTLYVTDNGNGRVEKCVDDGLGGADCTIIITGLAWPTEAAPDQFTGNIHVFAYHDQTAMVFRSDGMLLDDDFAGTAGVPYLTDSLHFNSPRGIEVDAKGNLYLVEESGHRMIKLSSAGVPLWTTGVAGIADFEGSDHAKMQSPTALAVDPSGKKLAVASSGWRVRFYDALTGVYLSDLHKDQEHYRFENVQGVAYDRSGNLYVSDRNAQTVKVYNKLGVYVREIGFQYESGLDNAHFNNPTGLAIDASGSLYVADHDNCRVQKFDKTGKYLMTFGTTLCGGSYDRMGGPIDVAVDAKKNVYVAEEWNSRVSVYSAAGAYLGYIGGEWGANTSGLRNPVSVVVNTKGDIFVADLINSRIQRFTASVPYAAKISHDNFGGRDNLQVWALGMFKGQLYAGTTNPGGAGLKILRNTKTGWEAVVTDGFEDGANRAIDSLYEYKGYLYASTYNCTDDNCTTSNGGQLWRSPDGMTWQPVIFNGFDNTDNVEIFKLGKLGTKLCASTWGLSHAAELWCSESGEPDTWTSEIAPGFGDYANASILALQEFKGMFFASTYNEINGPQVFRRTPGSATWDNIVFPAGSNRYASDMVVYKNYLYVITGGGSRSRIVRCTVCDGNDWEQVDGGFGGIESNRVAAALEVTKSAVYAVVGNGEIGLSVWKSSNGLTWTQVSTYGLGSSNNARVYWGNSVLAYGSNLYIGTSTNTNSGAVWKICSSAACK